MRHASSRGAARLAALRGAVLLAAGFIALRVVYRAVFGGAGGGGLLLADLPGRSST